MNASNRLENLAKKLTRKSREKLPQKDFAIPEERKYPIHDKNHARNALTRVSQNGTTEEKRRVRNAVRKHYPDIKQTVTAEANSSRHGTIHHHFLALQHHDKIAIGVEQRKKAGKRLSARHKMHSMLAEHHRNQLKKLGAKVNYSKQTNHPISYEYQGETHRLRG